VESGQRRAVAQELRSTTQEEEDLKVVEYFGGKVVSLEHSCRQNFAVSSIEALPGGH
jgi:hypothetical protein